MKFEITFIGYQEYVYYRDTSSPEMAIRQAVKEQRRINAVETPSSLKYLNNFGEWVDITETLYEKNKKRPC